MKLLYTLQLVEVDSVPAVNRTSTLERWKQRFQSVNFPSHIIYALILVLLALPASGGSTSSQTQSWHPLADIRQTAERFVQEQSSKPGQLITVTAGDLDARLRLHKCETQLEAYLTPGSRLGRNTTVGIRCRSPRKWKLFVPVRVGVTAEVLVATRPLAAGTILTSADFVSKMRDLSALHGGYIKAGETVSGMVLKRRLPEGEALRNELLTAPDAIRRGQKLTISSGGKSGSISIKMAGTALSNGRIGQRIRVKNHSSGRTVEGIVRSSESVEVGY